MAAPVSARALVRILSAAAAMWGYAPLSVRSAARVLRDAEDARNLDERTHRYVVRAFNGWRGRETPGAFPWLDALGAAKNEVQFLHALCDYAERAESSPAFLTRLEVGVRRNGSLPVGRFICQDAGMRHANASDAAAVVELVASRLCAPAARLHWLTVTFDLDDSDYGDAAAFVVALAHAAHTRQATCGARLGIKWRLALPTGVSAQEWVHDVTGLQFLGPKLLETAAAQSLNASVRAGNRDLVTHLVVLDSVTLSHLVIDDCDLALLARVPRVCLESALELVDATALAGVNDLTLRNCQRLERVDALGGCARLSLAGCRRVVNVSALGRVSELVLDGTSVEDVSALGGCTRLSLRHCSRLRDVSALGRVAVLRLDGCEHLEDVSALGGCRVLSLSHCARVLNVSALGGVEQLDLSFTAVADVSMLGGVRALSLRGCTGVVDASALCGVDALDVSGTQARVLGVLETVRVLKHSCAEAERAGVGLFASFCDAMESVD